MIPLLQAEWIKMRNRWMPRILMLIMIGIIALVLFGVSMSHRRVDLYLPRGLLVGLAFGHFFAPFLWPVLAGAWSGNEYGWGTIRMTLSRRPNRIEHILSALIMLMAVVAFALLVCLAMGGLTGALLHVVAPKSSGPHLSAVSGSGTILIKLFLAELLSIGFYVVLSYAAGTIFQSLAAGIGIGIGSWIAQEIVGALLTAAGGVWLNIAEHLPSAYAMALPVRVIQPAFPDGFFSSGSNAPSAAASLIGLLVYTGILLAITFIVAQRRDVTS